MLGIGENVLATMSLVLSGLASENGMTLKSNAVVKNFILPVPEEGPSPWQKLLASTGTSEPMITMHGLDDHDRSDG